MVGAEWVFDTAFTEYEKYRPGYVNELYKDIFEYKPVKENSRVLEIGIGTGQATLPILKTGCWLTAIEYGTQLTNVCREKFKACPRFNVVRGKFEEVEFVPETYDLIYSATAFHWIPEKIGYERVFAILKSGGVFARFANRPYVDAGRKELKDEIQDLYSEYMSAESEPTEFDREEAKAIAETAEKYGFMDIKYKLFKRARILTAKDYIGLLGTYSDHMRVEEELRRKFFAKIEQTINKHGGKITLRDTIDLELARKP